MPMAHSIRWMWQKMVGDAIATLSDVMGTGHHAAVVSRVRQGGTAAVIGDGAVGLCG
jgi:threonine dehydrogenase-like Zn-dependent dehydrogenase